MTNDVRSSLEVEMLGELPSGMPVAMDKYAYDADAFVVVNRVKPHTEFTYPFESGLMKMMAIGMGKEFGATVYHRYFLRDGYGETIEAIVDRITATRSLLFDHAGRDRAVRRTGNVRPRPGHGQRSGGR